MKVVTAQEMASLEKLAFKNGACPRSFMEEAGYQIAKYTLEYLCSLKNKPQVFLFIGKGNNGGDAYVAGRHLLKHHYSVYSYELFDYQGCSDLNRLQKDLFLESGGECKFISKINQIALPENGIILDGILGTGFRGKLPFFLNEVINCINQSQLPIFSIDIPSGINGNSGDKHLEAVKADQTFSLGLPKTGLFLQESKKYIGKLRFIDFGLAQEYIDLASENFSLLHLPNNIKDSLPLDPSQHKYQAGYVLGITGSKGMLGASALSSRACLRMGAGLCKVLQFYADVNPFLSPEVLEETIDGSKVVNFELDRRVGAVYIGPGMGLGDEPLHMLEKLISIIHCPLVIDADALTLLPKLSTVRAFSTPTILTPHMGEMSKLLQDSSFKGPISLDKLKQCQDYACDKQCILVLKGPFSFIFEPNQKIKVSSYGNPGMATAGSGDVLTGIIAALLAKKMSAIEAATLGVMIHGIIGEKLADKIGAHSLLSSDMIEAIPSLINSNHIDRDFI